MANSTFWSELEAQFRELPDPTGALTAMLADGKWCVHGGPSDERQREQLHESFRSLARRAAIAHGISNRVNAQDGWLNALRVESAHFEALNGARTQGGFIRNLCIASAEYCRELATRVFELEAAVAQSGESQLGLRRDRYPLASWLYDHAHDPLAEPKAELEYWRLHIWHGYRALIGGYARIVQENQRHGRPIWRDCRKKLNDAIVGLSYDLAVLQVNHIFDRGLGGGEAIRVFDDEAAPLLAEVESALRASGESLALSAEELNEEVKDLAQPFHCVRDDLRRLLDELPPASQAEVLVEEQSAKAGAEPAQVVGEGLSDAEIIAERSARRQAVVTPILRKKRWKPGTLVTKSGVGKATVYGYLNGTRSYIESENRTAIAQELELDPKDLPD